MVTSSPAKSAQSTSTIFRRGALAKGAAPHGLAAALDALAAALVPRLLPRLRAALAVDEPTKLLTPKDTPTPRATMEACRRGDIVGARKVHRTWMFTVSAWHAYVGSHPAAATPNITHTAPENPEDAIEDELRRELGFAPRLPRASQVPSARKRRNVHGRR